MPYFGHKMVIVKNSEQLWMLVLGIPKGASVNSQAIEDKGLMNSTPSPLNAISCVATDDPTRFRRRITIQLSQRWLWFN